MRKMFWGGIALMVGVGVGVVWTVHQAAHYPDSLVARCVSLALRGTGETAAVVQEPNALAPVQVTNPVLTPNRRVEQTTDEQTEPIVIDNQEGSPVQVEVNIPLRGSFDPSGSGDSETSEPPQAAVPAQTPAHMPYAEQAITADDAAELGVEIGIQLPGAGEGSATTPDASSAEQPCCMMNCMCGWIKRLATLMGFGGSAEQPVVEEPAVETPDPMPMDEAQDKDAPLGLPTMREDPNYHHQYPSCPYTGQCPYPYQYQAPSAQPVEPMQTPKPPKPNRKSHVHSSHFMPAPECNPECDVDTMECRPTDVPRQWRATRPF